MPSVASLLGAATGTSHGLSFYVPEATTYHGAPDAAIQAMSADEYADAWAAGSRMTTEAIRDEINRVLVATETTAIRSRPVRNYRC